MSNKLTIDEFLKKANLAHGDNYDYSKTIYIDSRKKIIITCREHGDFNQNPGDHLKGRGCRICGDIKKAKNRRKSTFKNRPDLSHISVEKGTKVIPVGTKGLYSLIDDNDFDKVSNYTWGKIKDGYAYNYETGLMHRLIMNCPSDKVVDHINHDVLDNRKSNLRICTHSQNMKNTKNYNKGISKYKGVYWEKRYLKWFSTIRVDNRCVYLGSFESEIEAAKEYNKACEKYNGEFACLNDV